MPSPSLPGRESALVVRGTICIAVGSAAFFAGGALSREAPDVLASAQAALPGVTWAFLVVSLLLSVWTALAPQAFAAIGSLTACWLVAAAFSLRSSLMADLDPANYVAFAECALIAAALASRLSAQISVLAIAVASATLVLFGLVHALHHGDVESLLPRYVPHPGMTVRLTSAAQILGGLAIASRHVRRPVAIAVSAMFFSWLPLVHLFRLISAPSPPRVEFAAVTLALAGALLVVASTASPRPLRRGVST